MVHKRSRQFNSLKLQERFSQNLNRAFVEVSERIEKYSSDEKSPVISLAQLNKIGKELENMELNKSSKIYSPTYPKMIVDSWEYSDPLGILLLQIYGDYLKL